MTVQYIHFSSEGKAAFEWQLRIRRRYIGLGSGTMKKTFDAIDIAKFLGSFLIFTMHCGALSDYRYISIVPQILARWGVPFFFICSAFFLFSHSPDGNIGKNEVKRYIVRIAILYAVWFVFNLPSVIYTWFCSEDLFALSTWLYFLKSFFLSATYMGSWYLMSSIFSAWLVFSLARRFKTKTIIGITSVFYLICVLSSAYYGVLPPDLAKVLMFLCFPINIFNGCFYFALGKYIAENQKAVIKVFHKKRAAIGFLVFYLIFILEICVTKHFEINGTTDVAFSTAAIAFSLFMFCLQADIRIQHGRLLRKLSTIVFCCQGNVLLLNRFLKKIIDYSFVTYLICTVVVGIICIVVLQMQKSKRWRWSRYLT